MNLAIRISISRVVIVRKRLVTTERMEATNIFTALDSLNRNLVFEVITLTDRIHIQYGDHTYRHVGDRVLKEGVKMSYWVHTLGPVAVRVVHLHTLL